jgi:threonine aldolase
MLQQTIDFRSDTVTQPTEGMKKAMFNAPLGDDVFGEDPSVNALESKAAAMFGMEAAIFCPSGTMTNQIAIKCHTQPGQEVVCDVLSHIYQYEGGGIAFNSGCSMHLIHGDNGKVTPAQVAAAVNNPNDIHKPITALVSLENTVNKGGGGYYDIDTLTQIKDVCTANKLPLHLDGARLFNALVASEQTPHTMGQVFDSISICLSKGLGAPVGSLLLGTSAFIHKAKRLRKVFGGGMRQAGILAAAGSYALDHHIERLVIDHQHAQQIAEALTGKSFVQRILPVATNIVIFETPAYYPAAKFVADMATKGILLVSMGPNLVRFVTHLDISEAAMEKTLQLLAHMN